MKKYSYYEFASESESTHTYEDYREAFSDYMKCDESATLYGVSEDGEISVIRSK